MQDVERCKLDEDLKEAQISAGGQIDAAMEVAERGIAGMRLTARRLNSDQYPADAGWGSVRARYVVSAKHVYFRVECACGKAVDVCPVSRGDALEATHTCAVCGRSALLLLTRRI